MPALYELALLGAPTPEQVDELTDRLGQTLAAYGLALGSEVGLAVPPSAFDPPQVRAAAALYFGGRPEDDAATAATLLRRAVPVIPVVSDRRRARAELPAALWPFNALGYEEVGPARVASALLEVVGLLPHQRRIFLSYRQDEARGAALQLFEALHARHYEVFLDTHRVPPGDDFQAVLWHHLSRSDALVMLDTPGYFDSRWTTAEYGRALAKGIKVLRVGWPDATPSIRTATAARAELVAGEIDVVTGRLADGALARIVNQLETVRSQSLAVRQVNLVGAIRHATEQIGGQLLGAAGRGVVLIRLPDAREFAVLPSLGLPTSVTLHTLMEQIGAGADPATPAAVVFDHFGVHDDWMAHLAWLAGNVSGARMVRATDVAWDFADWGRA